MHHQPCSEILATLLPCRDSPLARVKAGEKTSPTKVLVLPCMSQRLSAEIVEDAERVAAETGGWSNRAVGCCTEDVLVASLSDVVRAQICCAFEKRIMPFVSHVFPTARLSNSSLPQVKSSLAALHCAKPTGTACRQKHPPRPHTQDDKYFFVIKYTNDRTPSFGLHVDHTKVTVNIALSPSEDFEGGGTFIRASTATGVSEAARTSQGLCLRPRAGTALVHDGEVPHAGNKVTRGTRCALRTRLLLVFLRAGLTVSAPTLWQTCLLPSSTATRSRKERRTSRMQRRASRKQRPA